MCKRHQEAFHQKIYRWQINTWKMCSIIIKEMYIKTPMMYHYTPIIMAQAKVKTPNAGEDVKKPYLSYIVDTNVKWYSISENSLSVSYKPKPVTTIQLKINTLRQLSQRNGRLCSHKILYTNVYRNSINLDVL